MGDGISQGKYAVPDDVLVQVLSNGEIVLLNLATEGYYGLDVIGADLVGLLRDGVSLADAQLRLLDIYEVDAGTLDTDATDLVRGLIEHGLLDPLVE